MKTGINLTIVVINDGALGLIKSSQLADYGTAPSSQLATPDLSRFADVLGVSYTRIGGTDISTDLAAVLAKPGVALVEIPAREARGMRMVQLKGMARRLLRRT